VIVARCSARSFAGEANAVTAVLRGEAAAEGDLELLFLLQRVFPPQTRPRKAQLKTSPPTEEISKSTDSN
jgi:hypothetical protein